MMAWIAIVAAGAGNCTAANFEAAAKNAGSAALPILRDSIFDRCEEDNLKGCDDIADGTILTLKKKTTEGRRQVMQGASRNSPAKLRRFAETLQGFEEVPGASKYMGDILAVAKMIAKNSAPLDEETDRPVVRSAHAPTRSPDPPQADVATVVPPAAQLALYATADTDLSRMQMGVIVPTAAPDRVACPRPVSVPQLDANGVNYCVAVATGPFVVTDVYSIGPCGAEQFAIRGGETPAWLAWAAAGSPLAVHGGRLLIPDGAQLLLGARGGRNKDPGKSARCSIAWSGFTPYGHDLPEQVVHASASSQVPSRTTSPTAIPPVGSVGAKGRKSSQYEDPFDDASAASQPKAP